MAIKSFIDANLITNSKHWNWILIPSTQKQKPPSGSTIAAKNENYKYRGTSRHNVQYVCTNRATQRTFTLQSKNNRCQNITSQIILGLQPNKSSQDL